MTHEEHLNYIYVQLKELHQRVDLLYKDNAIMRNALQVSKLELEAQGCNEIYADSNSQLSYKIITEALNT